jgi:nucleotide-binding universal stress UspA family protein
MLHFRKILHPHDFSKFAVNAFHLACALARDHAAKVVVLHVNPLPPPAPLPMGAARVFEDEELALEEKLQELKSPYPHVDIEFIVQTGDVVEDVVRFAKAEDCDLIVMGTHGRTGVNRLLMGSVAEQVTRRADCPVVTVKSPAVFEEFIEPVGAVEVVR